MRAEDITAENLTAFWTAVATVIPVLALALVLESRIKARKWSKKQNYSSRRSRAVQALILAVLSASLVTSEYFALISLLLPRLDAFEILFAIGTVVGSAILVISQPIGNIASAALGDVRPKWLRSLPLDQNRRAERNFRSMSKDGPLVRVRLRAQRIEKLVTRLYMVGLVTHLEGSRRLTGEEAQTLERARTHLVEINVELEERRVQLAGIDQWLVRIENLRTTLVREREIGLTKKETKLLRKRLRDLGT